MTTPIFITAGPVEIALIIAIALLLFGHRLLPFISKRAGAVAERLRHVDDDVRDGLDDVE